MVLENEEEAAGEGPVLYEDPSQVRKVRKPCPGLNKPHSRDLLLEGDGLRAWIQRKGFDWVMGEAADILCL